MTSRSAGVLLVAALASAAASPAIAQAPSAAELQMLRDELDLLRAEEAERAARMDALERRLESLTAAPASPPPPPGAPIATRQAAAPSPAPQAVVEPRLRPAPQAEAPAMTVASAEDEVEQPEREAPILYPGEGTDLYGYEPESGSFAAFMPGRGFMIANTPHATLSISGYGLVRYLNQMPGDDTSFTDHLGNERPLDLRNDIQWHRTLVNFQGFLFSPKFRYVLTAWGVNSTEQVAMIGGVSYRFSDAFELNGGLGRHGGTASLMFSHPYWYAPDRVMADEFFRPGFTSGIWATGQIAPGLRYYAMVGNNLSQLGINAAQLTRDLAYSANLTWMPTTHEFGPREGFGDFEHHTKLATRFALYYTHSREDRFTQANQSSPENTQVRNSDSVLFFETGALAPGVTVQAADFDLYTASAAFKYMGWALHTEAYYRRLTNFELIGGAAPVSEVEDTGFYAFGSREIVPRTLSLYLGTSQIYGEFTDASEYQVGLNWFPMHTRNLRVNTMLIDVNHSAAGGLFGYYTGGQDGTTISTAIDILF